MCRAVLFIQCTATLLISLVPFASGENTATRNFLEASGQTVSIEEVHDSMRHALTNVLDAHDASSDAANIVKYINASLQRTFEALPKLAGKRLSPEASEYLIRSYFAKEHGWVIHGLGVHGSVGANASRVNEANILQEMAPAVVESLLQARDSSHGFAMDDVVAMVATLEYLVISDSARVLEQVYRAYGFNLNSGINEEAMVKVLTGYSILFEDRELLNELPELVDARVADNFFSLSPIDTLANKRFESMETTNPFVKQEYTFEKAWDVVTHVHRDYGKRQNEECSHLKDELMKRDALGKGRVPLHLFYEKVENAIFEFAESAEYLRDIGALDDSDPLRPKVLIANYVQGPSNCLSNGGYYSVCCISECESLVGNLESHIRAPSATAEELLSLVSNMSSSTVEAPRILSEVLHTKLYEVEEHHKGQVPLHGRLFAQWLHFAFPNECPYPAVQASTSRMELFHQNRTIPEASKEDRKLLISQAQQMSAESDDDDELFLPMWNPVEILHVPVHKKSQTVTRIMQAAALMSGLITLAKLATQMRHTALGACSVSKIESSFV